MTAKKPAPRSIRRLFPKVTEVVDATDRIEVLVTKRDCGREARRKNSSECAMARAVRRQYGADGAVIGIGSAYLIFGTKAVRYTTPPSVGREIASFDRHADFAPGAYVLSRISPSQRLASRHGRHRSSGSRGTEPKRVVHDRTVRVRALSPG